MLTGKKLLPLSLLLIITFSFSAVSMAASYQAEIIIQNINMLKSGDSSSADRRDAVEKLIKIGGAAVPALIKALQDDNPIVRIDVVEALRAIGPGANEAVPGLIKALQNRNANIRRNAAEALAVIGPWAKEAVPNLVQALKDKNPHVQESAAMALGMIGLPAKTAVPNLIKAIQKDNPEVKVAAAWALGRLGEAASAALPVLIKASQDVNSEVSENATRSLERISEVKVSGGEQTWEDYMAAAKGAFNQANYAEAERLLIAALIKTKKFNHTDPRLLITYRNFVLLYKKQKKFAKARVFQDMALKLNKKTYNKNNQTLAKELNNRATLLISQGKYAAAKELLEEAITINQQIFGETHQNVATNLANLASIYYMEGNFSKAEQLYRQALTIRQKVLGPNHTEVVLTLINLAELYRARGEDAKAESMLRRVASIRQQNDAGLTPPQKPTLKKGKATDQHIQNEKAQKVEKSPAKSESTSVSNSFFYANKTGRAYHYRSCYWVKNVPLDKLRKFKSAKEARKAGLHPCRSCRPPQ